jgi:hypothetical protein
LTSAEFQTVEAWREVLSQFAATDFVGGPVTLDSAAALLGRIARQTMFQPETTDARVHILGALEASGLSFDHLWVAGLDDETWPRPPNPNPFLPIRLQREAGLPRCSPKRELDFARRVTERLLGGSGDVVLSHAMRKEDRELGPSPLIVNIPDIKPGELNLCTGAGFVEIIQQSRSVEKLCDEKGPPLGEATLQRGGTKVFQFQSVCQRGILVHSVLEEIWKELRSHLALCSAADLEQKSRNAVLSAIRRFEEERGASIPPRFAALERERLERLVVAWLHGT